MEGKELVYTLFLLFSGQDLQPRYFVLFTNTLLILSYNSEHNTLSYEGKIPVGGVTLPPLSEKNKHLSTAFEIAGNESGVFIYLRPVTNYISHSFDWFLRSNARTNPRELHLQIG